MTEYYNHGEVVRYDKTSVALGTFDGLHTAHMKIIDKAVEYGIKNNLKSGVFMFDTIPANVISKEKSLMIMKLKDRYKILDKVDFVYTETFDKSFIDKTPEEFVDYLKNVLKAGFVSVGYNYRFGKKAAGDAELLKSLCKKQGIEVEIADKAELNGDTVSSTRIRKLVSEGKVDEAAKLLGRPFFLSGLVSFGYNNGHKMGIPTANLAVEEGMLIPDDGVYAGYCEIDGEIFKSAINVGNNPTFNGKTKTVECHLLDFSGNIYNHEIMVFFTHYLRKEIKFESPAELVQQIEKDIDYIRNIW